MILGVNTDRRKPLGSRAVKAMTPKHGNQAKKGYATYKPIIYGQRCKFCQGSGALYSVISKAYIPCSECQE